MTMRELERRLEELSVDFDELPTTSNASEGHLEEHKEKGEVRVQFIMIAALSGLLLSKLFLTVVLRPSVYPSLVNGENEGTSKRMASESATHPPIEESPENCLFEYLKRYKEICEKIALNEVDIAECEQLMKNCSANVWTVENRVLNQEVH
uniref:Uncharacterized protein n=1 Tax=Parascaris equorum TaxID=6256 RepID=A0A914S1B1_PAREQ